MCQSIKTLFIADGSLDRPILHSQGLPHLFQLSEMGVRCYILSFEKDEKVLETPLGRDLLAHDIVWLPVITRPKGKSVERAKMILKGVLVAWKLVHKEKINVIHCRSYRPSVIGMLLKVLTGVGFLFDMRGFLIDELVADGSWKKGSVKYFLAKEVEHLLLTSTDVILTVSHQARNLILSLPRLKYLLRSERVIAIRNCADLERFNFSVQARQEIRQRHDWNERLVCAFAGDAVRYKDTFAQILDFFCAVKAIEPTAFLALYAYGDHSILKDFLHKWKISPEDWMAVGVPPADVPSYLSAADLGLSFFKVINFSNAVCSPIKFSEYLACGLPIVINSGVSYTSEMVEKYQAGVVIDPSDPLQLQQGAEKLIAMVKNDSQIRQRCREVAERELNLDWAVKEYYRAYQIVANRGKRPK